MSSALELAYEDVVRANHRLRESLEVVESERDAARIDAGTWRAACESAVREVDQLRAACESVLHTFASVFDSLAFAAPEMVNFHLNRVVEEMNAFDKVVRAVSVGVMDESMTTGERPDDN